jgi:hypothetical protein
MLKDICSDFFQLCQFYLVYFLTSVARKFGYEDFENFSVRLNTSVLLHKNRNINNLLKRGF